MRCRRIALIAFAAAATLFSSLQAQQISTGVADLTVGGRLHVQYATSSVDDAVADIFLRRARLKLDVGVSDFVVGRIQSDFAGGETALQDAYVRLKFAPSFRLTVGQAKRAFSAFELASSTDLPFVERDGRIPGLSSCEGVGGVCTFSRLTEKLEFDGRDLGIRADGSLADDWSYIVSVSNGEGINTSDVNDGKSVSARLEYGTGDVAVAGFAAFHDHLVELPGDVEETEYADAVGLDLSVGTWRDGFHLVTSVVTGENWKAAHDDARFTTFQTLASLYLPVDSERIDGIEPLFRLSWGDPHTDADDDAGWLFTPGLMLYFSGKNGLSANVDIYSPQGDGDTEWSFKLMSYLFF